MNTSWGEDEMMVVAAFRYCCGRRTYVVGCCVEWLIKQWPTFADKTKAIIQRDLEEEFRRDDAARERGYSFRPLGDDCDRAGWERVRNLWEEENKRKKNVPTSVPPTIKGSLTSDVKVTGQPGNVYVTFTLLT